MIKHVRSAQRIIEDIAGEGSEANIFLRRNDHPLIGIRVSHLEVLYSDGSGTTWFQDDGVSGSLFFALERLLLSLALGDDAARDLELFEYMMREWLDTSEQVA